MTSLLLECLKMGNSTGIKCGYGTFCLLVCVSIWLPCFLHRLENNRWKDAVGNSCLQVLSSDCMAMLPWSAIA